MAKEGDLSDWAQCEGREKWCWLGSGQTVEQKDAFYCCKVSRSCAGQPTFCLGSKWDTDEEEQEEGGNGQDISQTDCSFDEANRSLQHQDSFPMRGMGGVGIAGKNLEQYFFSSPHTW